MLLSAALDELEALRKDVLDTTWQDHADRFHKRALAAEEHVRVLSEALVEISKGVGPFSRDPLQHATDTIESMKAKAVAALAATEPKETT